MCWNGITPVTPVTSEVMNDPGGRRTVDWTAT